MSETPTPLEPCPGHDRTGRHVVALTRGIQDAWVQCACGFAGPRRSSDEDAAEAWNRRAAPPPVQGAGEVGNLLGLMPNALKSGEAWFDGASLFPRGSIPEWMAEKEGMMLFEVNRVGVRDELRRLRATPQGAGEPVAWLDPRTRGAISTEDKAHPKRFGLTAKDMERYSVALGPITTPPVPNAVREALEAAVKVLPTRGQMLDEAALNDGRCSDFALAGEKCREALASLSPNTKGGEAC